MSPRRSNFQNPLPHTFTCRYCGKEQPPAAFSQNQIQKWYKEKRKDRHNAVTPQNVGLTCKTHSIIQRELRCNGPCDRVKVIEHFSKRQRNDDNPWCINCTEWRLSFDGDEIPAPAPNDPLAHYDRPSLETSMGELHSSLALSSDEEDDESDDDLGRPYDDPTLITGLLDRLERYNLGNNGEDAKTDAISTMGSAEISLWDKNNSTGSTAAGTVTIGCTRTKQNQKAPDGTSAVSHWGRGGPSTLGSTSAAANTTTASLSTDYQTYNPRTGRSSNVGGGTQTSFDRLISSRIRYAPASENEIKNNATALVKEALGSINMNHRGSRANNRVTSKKSSSQWYKGDNRKVFVERRDYAADMVEDRTEVAHDSESTDEM